MKTNGDCDCGNKYSVVYNTVNRLPQDHRLFVNCQNHCIYNVIAQFYSFLRGLSIDAYCPELWATAEVNLTN